MSLAHPRSAQPGRRRCRSHQGFSLVETLVVCALIGTLSAMAVSVGFAAIERARITRAIGDLRALDTDIRMYYLRYGRYPATLAAARDLVPKDPWGRPYEYTDLSTRRGKGKARKDRRLNPINADFDLYSLGEDGRSSTPLTAAASKDDVIRAREGGFYGLASEF